MGILDLDRRERNFNKAWHEKQVTLETTSTTITDLMTSREMKKS